MLQKINKHLLDFEKSDLLFKRWDLNPLSQNLHNAMYRRYPSNEKYYLEFNPSFVYEYQGIEAMLNFPFVMLRDGYLGLYYLFLRYPKLPENSSTIFLVPAKFSYLLPKSWENNVLLYDFEFSEKASPEDTVIVYGNVGKEILINKTIEEKVKEELPKSDKYIFVSTMREWGFLQQHSETQMYLEYQKELYKLSEFNVKTYNDFRPDWFNFVDGKYCSKNVDSEHFLIYDNYLTHFFASKGVKNINNVENDLKDEIIKTINLSPFHKMNIREPKHFSNYILEQKVETKLNAISLNLSSESFYEYAAESFSKKINDN